MYRQYEDPYKLQKEYEEELARQNEILSSGGELDEFDYERIAILKDRINFAWQDDEYEENERLESIRLGECSDLL